MKGGVVSFHPIVDPFLRHYLASCWEGSFGGQKPPPIFSILNPRNCLYKHRSILRIQNHPMSTSESFSFVRRLSQLGTLLQTRLCGVQVGTDAFGNRYYRERKTPEGVRQKRWVMYAGEPEASKVPPEWHIWLHHMAEAPIPDSARHAWQKPHISNQTGTPEAWMPPALDGKNRPKATGDYQAWKPE